MCVYQYSLEPVGSVSLDPLKDEALLISLVVKQDF